MDNLIAAASIGVGATLGMDLWNLFLKVAFDVPSLNYCFLGRWLCHMQRGRFRQRASRVVFALTFVVLMSGWLAQPRLLPALLYGLGTVVFPFLVMQPSLDLGVAGSRPANPVQARMKSVATHVDLHH